MNETKFFPFLFYLVAITSLSFAQNNDLDGLTEELIILSKSSFPVCRAFLSENGLPTPKARRIGEDLNRLGGMEFMLHAHKIVIATYSTNAGRCLEAAWDGIGRWQW